MENQSDNQDDSTARLSWERETLRELAFSALREQRRGRRWSIFFRLAVLSYFVALLLIVMANRSGPVLDAGSKKHTAIVELTGIITSETEANAPDIIIGLRNAFKDGNTAGVILRINSPGGSPVQAGRIHDEIRRLRAAHPKIPLYAVVEDVCASGGYYVAAAADAIYADKASIVGSVGVLINGFGFVDAMQKLGIERRLMTAGENKGFLDPFSPVEPRQQEHVEKMLGEIHRQFIDAVKQGRAGKLAQDDRLFTGLVWTGSQGLDLGLIDGLADVGYVARELIKVERLVDFTQREDYFSRFARRLGAATAEGFMTLITQQQTTVR